MNYKRSTQLIIATSIIALLSSCAKGPSNDPYMNYNRRAFAINSAVDYYTFKPIAKGYNAVTNNFVRTGIRNMFRNLANIPSAIYHTASLNFLATSADIWRLLINTTVGIGGWFDPASDLGIVYNPTSLNQTLYDWGYQSSSPLMLPILGPNSIRGLITGYPDYWALSSTVLLKPESLAWSATGVNFIQVRASLLPADKVIQQSFDPYVFVRDAYQQKMQQQMNQNLYTSFQSIQNSSDLSDQ